jgi:hypothetical protein
MKRWILLWLLLSAMHLNAQPINLAESTDYATFKADSGKVRIEFFIAFQKAKLPYQIQDSLARVELDLSLSAKEKSGFEKTESLKLVSSEKASTREEGLLIARFPMDAFARQL